jgi:hypothetical protein
MGGSGNNARQTPLVSINTASNPVQWADIGRGYCVLGCMPETGRDLMRIRELLVHFNTISGQFNASLPTKSASGWAQGRPPSWRSLHCAQVVLESCTFGALLKSVPGKSMAVSVAAWGSVQPGHRAATTQAGAINAVHRGAWLHRQPKQHQHSAGSKAH